MPSANTGSGARALDGRSFWLTRFLMLRLLGVVYLFAFLAAANQLLPLVGDHGLTPATSFLVELRAWAGSESQTWFRHPTLFLLGCSDQGLLVVSWTGVALAALCVAGYANALSMTLLWALYLSIVQVGQTWYGYGWEGLLLETGFLGIFLCPLLDPRPFPRSPPPVVVIWLHRWLLFRVMLGAGLIKMRGDECWRDLTALTWHYETQPIPNPISPWLHSLPRWFHVFGCLWNHFTELFVPWFVFGPRVARRAAGLLMVFFQVLLLLSGNLSFLNWLTLVACLACLDDGVWRRVVPRRLVAAAERAAGAASTSIAPLIASALLATVVAWLSVDPITNLLDPHQKMNTSFDPLHLVNTYGAFGSMDRVRYEIVFEGTDEEDPGPDTAWRPYEFKAKPGDPLRSPPWLSPYHLRIDWQMWFAAKSTPDRHAWTLHLVWKLLHNDEGALGLLARNPFPGRPPRYVRAELYEYRFAPRGSGAVWTRTRVRAWLPNLSVYNVELRESLVECGWLGEESLKPK